MSETQNIYAINGPLLSLGGFKCRSWPLENDLCHRHKPLEISHLLQNIVQKDLDQNQIYVQEAKSEFFF